VKDPNLITDRGFPCGRRSKEPERLPEETSIFLAAKKVGNSPRQGEVAEEIEGTCEKPHVVVVEGTRSWGIHRYKNLCS